MYSDSGLLIQLPEGGKPQMNYSAFKKRLNDFGAKKEVKNPSNVNGTNVDITF